MAALDPQIFQAALLEVAEATKTAAQAAQAVQKASASPSSSPTRGSAQTVDWSKLLHKPHFSSIRQQKMRFESFVIGAGC